MTEFKKSIIINHNPTLNNNKPYKFTAFFDENIVLGKDTKIGLYSISLKKDTIYFDEDQTFQIELQRFVSDFGNLDGFLGTSNNKYLPDLNIKIPKGKYNKQKLLQSIYQDMIFEIEFWRVAVEELFNVSLGSVIFPYIPVAIDRNDNVYLGLAKTKKIYNGMFYNVGGSPPLNYRYNLTFKNRYSITTGYSNDCILHLANSTIDLVNYSNWAISNGVLDLYNGNSTVGTPDKHNNGTMYFQIGVDTEVSERHVHFVVGFSNLITMYAGGDDANSSFDTIADKNFKIQNIDDNIYIPKLPFGMMIDLNYGKANKDEDIMVITIFKAQNIDGLNFNTLDGEYYRPNLSQIQVLYQFDTIGRLAVEELLHSTFFFNIYYENVINPADLSQNDFYFKIGCSNNEPNSNPNQWKIIYDSKITGEKLSRHWIEASYNRWNLADNTQNKAGTGVRGGLQPIFMIKPLILENLPTDPTLALSKIGFRNIYGNFIGLEDISVGGAGIRNSIMINDYQVKNVSSELQEIFGYNEKGNINPNEYPENVNGNFSITNVLLHQKSGYNVLINNLPIETAHNITTKPDLGSNRTIIHSTSDNMFNDVINETNSMVSSGSEIPPNIKMIKLNNANEKSINKIDVEIRNNRNNNLAVDIIDTKLELVIN